MGNECRPWEVFLRDASLFTRVSEKTTENSERLGQQVWSAIELGTSLLPVYSPEPLSHLWGGFWKEADCFSARMTFVHEFAADCSCHFSLYELLSNSVYRISNLWVIIIISLGVMLIADTHMHTHIYKDIDEDQSLKMWLSDSRETQNLKIHWNLNFKNLTPPPPQKKKYFSYHI